MPMSKNNDAMSDYSYLKECLILLLLLPYTYIYAQNNVTYVSNDSIYKIGFIDRSLEDSEIESYDIVVIDSFIADTMIISRNVPYVDNGAIKHLGSRILFISHECLIMYDLRNRIYDTVLHSSKEFDINAFFITSDNLAIVASVNYKTEDIIFSAMELTSKKNVWSCGVHEENIGLEYLRIIMNEKSDGTIDVQTNQNYYHISLSGKICNK